jgi:hypothetical protein
MSLEWYLAWYNLIFVVPFLLALVSLAAYAASGVTFGETETDGAGGTDAEADAEVEAEPDADVEAEPDAEVEAEVEAETEAEGCLPPPSGGQAAETVAALSLRLRRRTLARLSETAPFGAQLLRFFGVGRVPLSVLLMMLFFAWGFLGVSANALLLQAPRFADAPWQVSVPVALAGCALLGRAAAVFLARWLPTTETYARDRAALVGRAGQAILRIDQRFGMAAVRDARGNGHQVACRVADGAAPIEKGMPLRVAAYDAAAGLYFVTPLDSIP